MRYPFSLPGFADQFEVVTGAWSTQIEFQGQPLKFTKNQTELTNDAGSPVTLTRKGSLGDILPTFEMEGETYRVRPPLSWPQLIVAALPLTLIGVGGAIGGGLGGAAYMLNLSYYRKENWSALAQYGAVLATTVGAWIAYLVIAGSLSLVLS